ncbi:MAG TPA: SLC13 family permease [Longimicrobiales bacterium]|nr:SLC13 family permease [Longimicrobiales bacterium]
MTWATFVTLAVLLATGVALIRDLAPPATTMVLAVTVLLLGGVVTPAEAFGGFSNPAPITVAALFVVARAVERTGALQPLVRRILGGGAGPRTSLLRLLVPTAGVSAFMNNTPVVAMLTPQVTEWAHREGRPPSWYLMPLSFAAILGGTMTLVGTSTNIVVSGLLEDHGLAPLAMFELTPVGAPLTVLGLAVLVVLAPLLLPDRRSPRQEAEDESRSFVIHMVVVPGGPIDGRTVEEAGLRHLRGVFLAEIEPEGEAAVPAAPGRVLDGGDRLLFVGRADDVVDLQSIRGLRAAEGKVGLDLDAPGHAFVEVVVSAASPLAGRTLRSFGFRGRYQATVLAIHRAGDRVHAKLGDVRIRHGDTLILVADAGFVRRWRDRSDFLLVSDLGGSAPTGSRKAGLTLAIAVGMVLAAATGLLPMLEASLLAALILLGTRVLTPEEAARAVHLEVIVLIGAAFGLGAALSNSGVADALAGGVVAATRAVGPAGILFGVAVVTSLMTEIISNNAAVVLVFPVAMAAAAAAGLDPRPFAVAVALAGSSSFLSPIGYQTNTMVYGPGGYRVLDYTRLGLPLNLLVLALITALVPRVWPF